MTLRISFGKVLIIFVRLRNWRVRYFAFHAKDTEILQDMKYKYGIIGKQLGKNSEWDSGWWRYRIPGWGDVDWLSILRVLNDINYSGPMVMSMKILFSGGDRTEEGLRLGLKISKAVCIVILEKRVKGKWGFIMNSVSLEIKNYSERVCKAANESAFNKLEDVANILLEARINKKWIYLAGNGGSASTASHIANDFVKGLSIDGKLRFRTKALCDSTPIMTAIANDYSYDRIFVEQLKNYASEGDVLFLISGSGNSPNVVNGARYGKENGMTVISFTGRDGGNIKGLSDICCIAPTNSMEEIEDIHMLWGHALITALESDY